ncbi:hypothetical protein BGZ94_007648 [Podila epigama]|nr:hypothetical protein BGZ94_007648 [Podila epigama]
MDTNISSMAFFKNMKCNKSSTSSTPRPKASRAAQIDKNTVKARLTTSPCHHCAPSQQQSVFDTQ